MNFPEIRPIVNGWKVLGSKVSGCTGRGSLNSFGSLLRSNEARSNRKLSENTMLIERRIVKVSPSWPDLVEHPMLLFNILFALRHRRIIKFLKTFLLVSDEWKNAIKIISAIELLEPTRVEEKRVERRDTKNRTTIKWNWGRKYCSAWRSTHKVSESNATKCQHSL